jgi:HEAT repeat protein
MVARIHPDLRTGEPLEHPWMDPAARHTWQYVALLEALARLPDDTSRALLRTATHDRDPAVRRAAVRSLRAIRSDDPADRAALEAVANDPSAAVAREVPRAITRANKAAPEKPREKMRGKSRPERPTKKKRR